MQDQLGDLTMTDEEVTPVDSPFGPHHVPNIVDVVADIEVALHHLINFEPSCGHLHVRWLQPSVELHGLNLDVVPAHLIQYTGVVQVLLQGEQTELRENTFEKLGVLEPDQRFLVVLLGPNEVSELVVVVYHFLIFLPPLLEHLLQLHRIFEIRDLSVQSSFFHRHIILNKLERLVRNSEQILDIFQVRQFFAKVDVLDFSEVTPNKLGLDVKVAVLLPNFRNAHPLLPVEFSPLLLKAVLIILLELKILVNELLHLNEPLLQVGVYHLLDVDVIALDKL